MSKGWACIARLGGIGDNLIAASVLRPLKQLGYMVEVITEEPNHVVFFNNPHIDKLAIKKGVRDLPQGDQLAWVKWFEGRAHEYDLFVNLSHSCEARHALFPASTQFYWPIEYRRKFCAGSYIETVMDIAGVPHIFGPLYYASEEEKQRASATKAKVGNRCVGWVLSGTRIDKVHPYSPHAIARIIKELGIPVIVFGAPSAKEYSMAEAIEREVKNTNGSLDGFHECISKIGTDPLAEHNWPIRRSLAQLMACDLVITPDTGPAWAVAFEPMPKIMLVSHASAENLTKHWVNTVTLHADPQRVPCWPCHRLHDTPDTCVQAAGVNGAACMTDISVETIITNVRAALCPT